MPPAVKRFWRDYVCYYDMTGLDLFGLLAFIGVCVVIGAALS